jgi:hypothetical protein
LEIGRWCWVFRRSLGFDRGCLWRLGFENDLCFYAWQSTSFKNDLCVNNILFDK